VVVFCQAPIGDPKEKNMSDDVIVLNPRSPAERQLERMVSQELPHTLEGRVQYKGLVATVPEIPAAQKNEENNKGAGRTFAGGENNAADAHTPAAPTLVTQVALHSRERA
jgi:hypothetical protein